MWGNLTTWPRFSGGDELKDRLWVLTMTGYLTSPSQNENIYEAEKQLLLEPIQNTQPLILSAVLSTPGLKEQG